MKKHELILLPVQNLISFPHVEIQKNKRCQGAGVAIDNLQDAIKLKLEPIADYSY